MRSARLVAPRRWELLDLPIPEPTPGTMLVHLERTAVCGSDKPAYVGLHGDYPLAPGSTGHEGMGLVEACPSGRYRQGERVLLYGFDRPLYRSMPWPATTAAAFASPPTASPTSCS